MKKNLNKMYDAMFMPLLKEAINNQKKNTITIVMSNPDGDKCALCICFALNTNTKKYFLTNFMDVSENVGEWVNTKGEEIVEMFFDNKVEPFKFTDGKEVRLWMENQMKCAINGDIDMFIDLTK